MSTACAHGLELSAGGPFPACVAQVKYKDGEKTIVVPSDAEVVNLVAGGKADLKTGAHVFIPRWEKQGDGTWQATVVVVGRDGITPPM